MPLLETCLLGMPVLQRAWHVGAYLKGMGSVRMGSTCEVSWLGQGAPLAGTWQPRRQAPGVPGGGGWASR